MKFETCFLSESLKMRMTDGDSKLTERAYSDKSGEHGAVAESLDRYVFSCNQCSCHGYQCSCHGNRCSCHGNQRSCHGDQCSCHGNQCSCHGNQCSYYEKKPLFLSLFPNFRNILPV